MNRGIVKLGAFGMAICLFFLVSCGKKEEGNSWLLTFSVPAEFSQTLLDNQDLSAIDGKLYIQNHANTEVTILLFETENLETPSHQAICHAGSVLEFLQLDSDRTYHFGIQAKTAQAREIELAVTDYPNGTPYSVS